MATNVSRSILRGQYPIRQRGHDNCPDHRENNLVFLCQHCKTLICSTCTLTTHREHSFIEISKIVKTQKHELQDFVNNTDDIKIPKFKAEIKFARKELSICVPKYKQISEDIKKQRVKCIQELDKISEDQLVICDKMEKAATDLLQTHITNLEDGLDILVKLSSEGKQTLQTGTAVLVYDSISEIQDMGLDIPQTPNIDMTEFTPGNDRQSHLEQAMGKMKTPTDHLLCDRPIVISQFSYKEDITSICPTSDGRAWLCDCDTNNVKLINNKGQVIQKIQHNSSISDISLDPTTGRLWFCCRDDRTIYEVSTLSTPVTRFTTEGVDPRSLCVTREGLVMVGTLAIGTLGYKVVMYTVDGQVLHTATVEGSGTGAVLSITQCGVTGNIALLSSKLISGDSSDPDNFRQNIVVYNPTLQALVHYRGERIQARKAVTPDKFDPVTVVYDSKGNIVIADMTRNTIELISGVGKYIKTLHTNKGPQGQVGIQKGDVLWSNLDLDKGEDGLKLLKYYID